MHKWMTKKEAEQLFKEICPNYRDMDQGQKNLEWALFTDSLCKDYKISQYKYDTWMTPSFLTKP